jgi:ADP-ribose pyrophosphatase YjhB (NUDIX family)
MTRQDDFMQAVTNRNIVRVRVAGVVVHDGRLLVQRPTDEPESCYALIGGEYEIGDTFESRLRAEFEEETNVKIIHSQYLFVVENRFLWNGKPFHGVEHYLEVEIDRFDVESRESHLSQHWLPLDTLAEQDLRPHVVRDAIASGDYRNISNLVVPFEE